MLLEQGKKEKLGVIVNPLAGMGGRVGLKGSDGVAVLDKARELGATPESPMRAVEALKVVYEARNRLEVFAYPHEMGQDEAVKAGLSPTVIGSIIPNRTGPADTIQAALDMKRAGVDLLLFAGGDGTARDIYDAIGNQVPAVGIPSGVKIHSAVFAVTPRQAGELALKYLVEEALDTVEAEVMDIDEEAFRAGRVSARLYGYLRVPEESRMLQGAKSGGIDTEEGALLGIAAEVVRNMEPGCLYIIGPGTTTRAVMNELELENTLLGVDVVLDRALLIRDANENILLGLINRYPHRKKKIIVTAIGGQGHILGRGNQQLSPVVVREVGPDNIVIVASRAKLHALGGRPLLVDTGDPELDRMFSGFSRVTTGFREYAMYRVGM
jgi:predicted polyphosphate/ATP-dependent NAD kinase